MRCLVVVAHPLADSLCQALADSAISTLKAHGHDVMVENLYAANFAPALTATERQSYYCGIFDAAASDEHITHLLSADAVVLVFPTWWFGFPAILKGWFDRIWAPGIAYDHATDLGAIQPRLDKLHHALAITTLGSPWWVDRLVLWQPVKRILKTALLGTCAPRCRFEMLSLYRAESLSQAQVTSFCKRIEHKLSNWR